jgi:hypothetical protein
MLRGPSARRNVLMACDVRHVPDGHFSGKKNNHPCGNQSRFGKYLFVRRPRMPGNRLNHKN